MTCIRIISVDPPGKAIDLAEEESALAFKIAEKLGSTIIDILRDGHYAFSICRLHGENCYWVMFQRHHDVFEHIEAMKRRPSLRASSKALVS